MLDLWYYVIAAGGVATLVIALYFKNKNREILQSNFNNSPQQQRRRRYDNDIISSLDLEWYRLPQREEENFDEKMLRRKIQSDWENADREVWR